MSEHIFTPDEFADLPIPHLEEHKFTLTADGKIAIRVIGGTGGDMLKATYDPRLIAGDVFDYENMTGFTVDSEQFTGNGKAASPLALSSNMTNLVGFFNGATIDNVQGNIVSDGVTVTASLEKFGGGDIVYKSSLGFQTIDCTPAQTVTLTPGSDEVPQLNHMYIDVITNTFKNSTSGFPVTEYVPLAVTYIGSATLVQSDGTYKTHQWSDHIDNESGVGHLTDINQWIREQHATHVDGAALSESGSGTSTVQIEIASGVMYQLHRHVTESISLPADFYIINDETTAFNNTNNLADIVTDSTGGSLNNKYYSLVVWYVYSEIPGDSKLYINKSSGVYSSESDARADGLKYTNFNIPTEFKGTGILIKRLICRLSGGNVTIYPGAGDDLRGTLPNTAAGSSTSISSTFLDSTFEIQNITDSTKKIKFSAAGISSGTTRTATMPDKDIILADNADLILKAAISGQIFTGAISATNLSGTNTGDNAANTNSGLIHTTGVETKAGLMTFSDGLMTEKLKFYNDRIENYLEDSDSSIHINYLGYNSGLTRFRSLNIYDGKTNIIMRVDGSTRKIGFGTVTPREQVEIMTPNGTSCDLLLSESSTYGWRLRNNQSGNNFQIDGTSDFSAYSTMLTISTAGNVLVGTTTDDGYKLNVNGESNINGTTINGAAIEVNSLGSGDRNSFVDFHSDDTNTDRSARIIRGPGVNGSFSLANVGTGSLALGTNNSVDFTIFNGGDIGMGTPLPEGKVHIVGTASQGLLVFDAGSSFPLVIRAQGDVGSTANSSAYRMGLEYGVGGAENGYIDFVRGTSGGNGYLRFGTSGIDRMTLDSGGKLTVDGDLWTQSNFLINKTGTGWTGAFQFLRDGSAMVTAQVTDVDDLKIFSNSTAKLLIHNFSEIQLYTALLKTNAKVNHSGLPTSSSGLSSGDLWNNSGIINII